MCFIMCTGSMGLLMSTSFRDTGQDFPAIPTQVKSWRQERTRGTPTCRPVSIVFFVPECQLAAASIDASDCDGCAINQSRTAAASDTNHGNLHIRSVDTWCCAPVARFLVVNDDNRDSAGFCGTTCLIDERDHTSLHHGYPALHLYPVAQLGIGSKRYSAANKSRGIRPNPKLSGYEWPPSVSRIHRLQLLRLWGWVWWWRQSKRVWLGERTLDIRVENINLEERRFHEV